MSIPTFSDFWAAYPRKRKKLDAEKAWNQALRRGVTPEQVITSLEIMKATEWRRRELEFLPYPASFLRAEAFDERTEALEDEKPELYPKVHFCDVCKPGHEWIFDGDLIDNPPYRKATCAKAYANRPGASV